MTRSGLIAALVLLAAHGAAAAPAAVWEDQARGLATQITATFVAAGMGAKGAQTTRTCPMPGATVTADVAEDAGLGCEGFERAARFMAERGYRVSRPVRIYLVDRFPDRYLKYGVENTHGFYDSDTGEVYLKSLRRFLKTSPDATPLGLAPTRELLVSYVAHEAGHHLSFEAFAKAPAPIPRAHAEFISYALQIATLAPAVRDELVRMAALEGPSAFESAGEITLMLHDMDPRRFALKSYLFFATPAGEQALRDVLAAKVAPPDQ